MANKIQQLKPTTEDGSTIPVIKIQGDITFSEHSKEVATGTTSNISVSFTYQWINTATISVKKTTASWIGGLTYDAGTLLEGGTVSFNVTEANQGNTDRTCTITISATDANENPVYDTLLVTQKAGGGSGTRGTVTPSVTSVTVPLTGGTDTVTYALSGVDSSTISVSSDSSWLDIMSCSVNNFVWRAYGNTKTETRTAKVTISAKNATDDNYITSIISFSQAGEDYASITFTPDRITVGESEETTYQKAYFEPYNIAGIVQTISSADWLHIGSGGGLSDRYINYWYDANTGDTRVATLRVIAYGPAGQQIPVEGSVLIVQDKYTGYVEPKGYITATDVFTDYQGGTFEIEYDTVNVDNSTVQVVSTTPSGVTYTLDKTNKKVSVTVSENTSEEYDNITSIGLQATGTDGKKTEVKMANITQSPMPTSIEFPIWKDTETTIESSDALYVDYIFEKDGEQVYSGRAYLIDGVANIRLNDIMQDFFYQRIDLDYDGLFDTNGYFSCNMGISYDDGATYQLYRRIYCYNDWSYEETDSNVLSEPIQNFYDIRQKVIFSAIDYCDTTPTIMEVKSKSTRGGVPAKTQTYTMDRQTCTVIGGGGVKWIEFKIGNNTHHFDLVDIGCYKYCLYYKNARGGYDWLLVGGNTIRTDNYERMSFKKKLINTTAQHNTVVYKNTIKPQWELNTDYMTDAQASKMHNLFGSNEVYLHDLEHFKIVPVNISDKNCQYKYYKNGRKMPQYKIKVELAQERKRR